MKYVIGIIVLAVFMAGCVSSNGVVVPDMFVPEMVSEEQATKIVAKVAKGEYLGTAPGAVSNAKWGSEKGTIPAWEVMYLRPGGQSVDIYWVDMQSGEVVSQDTLRISGASAVDSFLPDEELAAAIDAAKVDSEIVLATNKQGLRHKAYEIRIERPSGFIDLIYVSVDTGEIIRTAVMSGNADAFLPDEEFIRAIEAAKVGSRIVHAQDERKVEHKAYEVRIPRESGFIDLIYVSVETGEIIRTDVISGNADAFLPDEEMVQAIEAALVDSKIVLATNKQGLRERVYEVRIDRSSGYIDLIYISVETGEIIRTDIMSGN